MFRPTLNSLACCLLAAIGLTLVGAIVGRSLLGDNRAVGASLLSVVVAVVGLYRLAFLVWRGGALRKGRPRRHAVTFQDGNTVWLGDIRMSRSTVLEMWAVSEDPPAPGTELTYVVRSAGGGSDSGQIQLPSRSSPPWWLRNRHSQPRPRVFSGLAPGHAYEYGVCPAGMLRAPCSLWVYAVRTFSLKALCHFRPRRKGN
jgi:hypothetical protein